ncbi:MAG TPA: NADH-quinone oxidoreductase subunit J [Steroidobacteraceae bacterium]|jgi:NADH-quinone oxidoreductase subunit J|nr:NADH-quinone oxidoreductase subunit J [Steroidobacteraceae bacterium]
MLVQFLFYAFATVLVASALGVIVSRNPVHSALSLVLCFVTSAAIWLLIEAEFLAVVLVLVYVGAVMVLFLFVVMMLDINTEELRSGFTRYAWLGWIIAGVVIAEIVGVVTAKGLGVDMTKGATPLPRDYSNTTELGTVLYTKYAYPFELAAVLLLVAIVAAIALTMRKRPGHKVQDISAQTSVRAQDRIRIVKMAAVRPEEPAATAEAATAESEKGA